MFGLSLDVLFVFVVFLVYMNGVFDVVSNLEVKVVNM